MDSTETGVDGPTSEEARRHLVSISPFFIVKNLQASIATLAGRWRVLPRGPFGTSGR